MIAWLASHLWLILSGLGATGVGVLGFMFPATSVPILEAIWGWLCHRSFWQLVCLALGCVIVVQHFTSVGAHRTIAKLDKQIVAVTKQRDDYKHQLDSISTAKNTQKTVTQTRIEQVTKVIHDADQRAKVVETAPPAPNCKTKPEVLQADL